MPENPVEYQERLATLRMKMRENNLDGWIIPRTDEYQGEFLAPYAERLAWLTGFTGSAGAAVILSDEAVVMSDGRYTIQLEQQVDATCYMCADSTQISIGQWIAEHAKSGARIGYDAWLHTPSQIENMQDVLAPEGIVLVPANNENLIDTIWHDQPEKPLGHIILFPDEIAGKTSSEKRKDIASSLIDKGANACLITMSDSICWLLNVRGKDIDFSPLVLSYAILHDNGDLDWFVDTSKLSQNVRDALGAAVRVHAPEDIERKIKTFSGTIAIDTKFAPVIFESLILEKSIDYITMDDPCSLPRSVKTAAEQEAILKAHIIDGVAIVKFLKWVEDNANILDMDELSVEQKLESFRQEHKFYLGPSFSTIAGFAENGAIVHYRATPQSTKKIKGDGLLLVDSGGQYKWGTTDITRTLPIGTPSLEMKENYTRVLQGHINVAMTVFDPHMTGAQIDALARAPLQDVGLDYAHGTGHGVGCYLCVHEAASNLSPRSHAPLMPGMLLSNEPGYYKQGAYGIRLENLIITSKKETATDRLCFKTVTFAPFARNLICVEMLSEEQLHWLNSYNQEVMQSLTPYLDDQHIQWLEKQCAPLSA